jgi:hypothetical protein
MGIYSGTNNAKVSGMEIQNHRLPLMGEDLALAFIWIFWSVGCGMDGHTYLENIFGFLGSKLVGMASV